MENEEVLLQKYSGMRCPECGILLISKYAKECREKFTGEVRRRPVPKWYYSNPNPPRGEFPEKSRGEIERDKLFILPGCFNGVHIIRNGYCKACDTEEKSCIYATGELNLKFN